MRVRGGSAAVALHCPAHSILGHIFQERAHALDLKEGHDSTTKRLLRLLCVPAYQGRLLQLCSASII